MRVIIYSLTLLSLLSLGCLRPNSLSDYDEFKESHPDRSDKEIFVPKALVKILERRYLWHFRELNPESVDTDVQILSNIPRKFLSLNIYIFPTNNKLALEDALHFNYPRGGGVIDLKTYIKGKKGSFNLVMQLDKQASGIKNSDLRNLKVYFMSNSRRREIGRKSHGSGCNRFMEVTQFFKEEMSSKRGIKLNATAARYVSVISGTFYFALFKGGELYLASSSFEDSRWHDLQCNI